MSALATSELEGVLPHLVLIQSPLAALVLNSFKTECTALVNSTLQGMSCMFRSPAPTYDRSAAHDYCVTKGGALAQVYSRVQVMDMVAKNVIVRAKSITCIMTCIGAGCHGQDASRTGCDQHRCNDN